MPFFGSIADVFYQWEYFGVFDFVLPFLLVFAIVFGILSSTKFLGEHKGVYIVISLVIGLMSLRYQYFMSSFFSEIFPRLGIGLAVLFSLMILVGVFIGKDDARYWGYGLATIGALIALIIVYQSFDRLGFSTGNIGNDSIGLIVMAVLLIGIIIAVAASGGSGSSRTGSGKGIHLTGWGS